MITAAGGVEIKVSDDLTSAITKAGTGNDLELSVRRGDEQIDVTVTVGSRDA